MHSDMDVHEPRPPRDPDSPLSFSMEGYEGQPPASLIPRFWAPGWNSIQSVNKFQSEVGGPLRGGDPGRRVIGPSGDGVYFEGIPEAFRPRVGETLIIPVSHIFGSEELSILSQGIAQLSPRPYIGLGPSYAAVLSLDDGDEVELSVGNGTYVLPVKYLPHLPDGLGGIPAGVPGLAGVALPAFGEIGRVKSARGETGA